MDQDTLQKVIKGDQQAFRLLVDHQKHMVYNLCYQILLNHEEAEEAAQDTFVKVFLSIKTFKRNSKLSSWIYRIAYNTALSKTRKKKVKLNTIESITEKNGNNNTSEELKRIDQKEQLNTSLNHLLPNERGLITMYYFDELSIKEIQKVTGMTASNIKVSIHRSRKKLKSVLEATLKSEAIDLIN